MHTVLTSLKTISTWIYFVHMADIFMIISYKDKVLDSGVGIYKFNKSMDECKIVENPFALILNT